MAYQLKKVGILWGGGLGDLLMIRPFLLALHADAGIESYLLTTAAHASELFNELCSPTRVILLPRGIFDVSSILKQWGRFFDLIYMGPHPTFKTRILGHLLAPQKLWGRYNKETQPYLLEQVLADTKALGLDIFERGRNFTSFLPWKPENNFKPFADIKPFLVLHPGAKERWRTTLWPLEHWKKLTKKLLDESDFYICIVGVASEAERLNRIVQTIPNPQQNRIKLCLSWPLRNTASLIASSAGVICHNSGILHLATFLHKKTLCITGSSAEFWRPPYPWVINIISGACSLACNSYICPIPFFRAKCINKTTVNQVWEASVAMLEARIL